MKMSQYTKEFRDTTIQLVLNSDKPAIQIDKGFIIQGAVVDGKRGVIRAFGDIPIQMYHFHQIAIVKRYLTRKPKLEASIDLLKISHKLTLLTEDRFSDALNIWHLKYKSFLDEKTLNVKTNRLTPTHARLVSAYRSLKTNLPYLFTYKNYKDLIADGRDYNIHRVVIGSNGDYYDANKIFGGQK